MKKIILLFIAVLTIITITVPVYAIDEVVLLETKINESNILYGQLNKTINQVITENYSPTNTTTYISIIPNETTATVLQADIYYQNVKTIMITYQGQYAVVTLYSTSNNYLNELYIYIPDISEHPITIIPNQSTYDNGYQQGLKDGYDNGYYTARRIFGIEINGTWLTSVEYAAKQVATAIDNTILEWGIKVDGILYNATEWGNMRYQQGLDANPNSTILGTLLGGVATIFGTGLAFILQLGSIELMGISLNMILGIGLLIVGLLAILGLIFGGK